MSDQTRKHTPGPWTIDRAPEAESLDGYSSRLKIRRGLQTLSFVPQTLSPDEQEANAQLIAAAPDLLKALESVWPYFEGEHSYDHPHCVKIREAINKAVKL